MYQKGDLIMYGNVGVCRVEEVGVPQGLSMTEEGRVYYTLTPVFGSGIIYIPVNANVFMRPVITEEQARQLILKIPQIQEEPYYGKDQKGLEQSYRTSMNTHECEDLVQLIKNVYVKSQKLTQNGRKPGKTDLQYKKRAEELLHSELAVALDIPVEEIPQFIEQEVNKVEVGA